VPFSWTVGPGCVRDLLRLCSAPAVIHPPEDPSWRLSAGDGWRAGEMAGGAAGAPGDGARSGAGDWDVLLTGVGGGGRVAAVAGAGAA
jgi:hypothetical protein